MENLWIVVAIAVAIILIVLLLAIGSGKIGQFRGRARVKHGDTEVDGGFEMDESKLGRPPSRTVVKGNVMRGENQKMRVAQENAAVEENLMEGKHQEMNIDGSENKSPRSEYEDKA